MKPITLIFLLLLAGVSSAGVEYREFKNPEQQEAYESLTSELRCLVCQNQTIADSNADLAADLRRQVYEMLEKGQSKDEVVKFMTERYGDFVLYKPPFKVKTLLLWLGPVLFFLIGALFVIVLIRRKQTSPKPSLSDEQRQKIRRLLDEGDRS
ncbi:cytochrome c-type biogenesis protein [Methylomicrobium lacus]|uniref:cytochrome c-type biogenesis protein n=1 Tax=Methylomicrobium lacus TaxID=136992 RepID=UPI00045E684E|nr:cytochrome c-type biogenesis protein [Methylomicrobium lacus]